MTRWFIDPLLPLTPLVVLCTLLLGSALFMLWQSREGWWRLAFALALTLILLNPSQQRAKIAREPDIALLVRDQSASMALDTRGLEAEKAAKHVLASQNNSLTWRIVDVPKATQGMQQTALFTKLEQALSTIPANRLAGAVIISDGQIHDTLDLGRYKNLNRPIHALIAGAQTLNDRRLRIIKAPPYAVTPQKAELVLRAEAPASNTPITLRWSIDGQPQPALSVAANQDFRLQIPITRRGNVDVTATLAPAPGELVLGNNSIATRITGVRDRLSVLLVSGQPYPGGRLWRDVLKADPAIDLVHFTILRLPTSLDPTPSPQLALIPFPVDELFRKRLSSFDLIIFDRYGALDLLDASYIDAVAQWVEEGGALLVVAGPEFARPDGLGLSALARVLPARPTGKILSQQALPSLSPDGKRHPITDTLQARAQSNTSTNPVWGNPTWGNPTWGAWDRASVVQPILGRTLLTFAGAPLLQVGEPGRGRVALLASDQLWSWARVEPGGPWDTLLRRLAHWLMREPDLEAERFEAIPQADGITLIRRGFAIKQTVVTLTRPNGRQEQIPLTQQLDGSWQAKVAQATPGLYQFRHGTLGRSILVGSDDPEFSDIRPTTARLAPLAQATGGSVFWINEGLPAIQRISASSHAGGSNSANSLGLVANQSGRLLGVVQHPLIPAWLALLVLSSLGLAAWLSHKRR